MKCSSSTGPSASRAGRRASVSVAAVIDRVGSWGSGAEQRVHDLLEGFRQGGLQELVGDLADRLRGLPSVQLLRAAVPVGDRAVQVTDEDGVVREVEEIGLLA